MNAAKHVQDAAQGAMVLAAASTFNQLSLESIRNMVLVVCMGNYVSRGYTSSISVGEV